MNILITGGAGFVGSSLAIFIKQKYPKYEIYSFDNLKRRGSELNIKRLQTFGIKFIHGDVRIKEDLFSINKFFDVIIDASAECSVNSGSDNDSEYVVKTNLIGTINCLELAKNKKSNFIFLSTSRVYSIDDLNNIKYSENKTRFTMLSTNLEKNISTKGVSELFSTNGFKSLYGATKLSSELLLEEYSKIFNFKYVINRCGIIAGPWQMGNVNQGIITTWLANHFWKRPLMYTGFNGEGKQVRDLLDIRDLCELIIWQIDNIDKISGQIYNIGGGLNNTISLLELTSICQEITDNEIIVEKQPITKKTDIPIYITDISKIKTASKWEPVITIKQTLKDTYEWIKKNEKNIKNIIG